MEMQGHRAVAERRKEGDKPYCPTAPRLAGFQTRQPLAASRPLLHEISKSVACDQAVHAQRHQRVTLPTGCTHLSMLQFAEADIVVVEKFSDMDNLTNERLAASSADDTPNTLRNHLVLNSCQ